MLYIPIDPADIGRNYKAIIRINSQSGKGGVAYILENVFGYDLPKLMQREVGRSINVMADKTGRELSADDIHQAFLDEYLNRKERVAITKFRSDESDETVSCECEVIIDGQAHNLTAEGNGPIDAFMRSLDGTGLPKIEVQSYSEHSLGKGAKAKAVSYIQIETESGLSLYGAGSDNNIEFASIKAIVSAVNRVLAKK